LNPETILIAAADDPKNMPKIFTKPSAANVAHARNPSWLRGRQSCNHPCGLGFGGFETQKKMLGSADLVVPGARTIQQTRRKRRGLSCVLALSKRPERGADGVV
jgi:hypothetical protein